MLKSELRKDSVILDFVGSITLALAPGGNEVPASGLAPLVPAPVRYHRAQERERTRQAGRLRLLIDPVAEEGQSPGALFGVVQDRVDQSGPPLGSIANDRDRGVKWRMP